MSASGVLLAAWLAVGVPGPITDEAKQAVVNSLQETLTRQAYVAGVNFGELRDHLLREEDRLRSATTEEAFAAALNESIRNFGISHVGIMPPMRDRRREGPAVIGVGVHVRPAPGGVRVVGFADEGAGAKDVLKAGDVIVLVDGRKPQSGADLEGKIGSVAVLKVRKLSGAVVEVRLPRVLVESPRTRATMRELSSRTVLIRVPTFGGDYDPSEIEALFERAFWYEGVVLDLRGNGGGAVTHLLHLLSFFLPEGTHVGTPVSNAVAAGYVAETGGDPSDAAKVAAWSPHKFTVSENAFGPYPGRVAVLLDGGSASASEVSSCALRELRGATIVGSKSAGALLVSTHADLAEGFSAQIPISDYITIRGFRPEGMGVEVDIMADAPRGKEDPGASAARRALEKGSAIDAPGGDE